MTWTISSNFEAGAVGQVASGTSGFHYAGASTTYSNEVVRGAKSARMVWTTGSFGEGLCQGAYYYSALGEGAEIWVRGYYYFKSPWSWSQYDSGQADIIKMLRVHVCKSDGSNSGYHSVFAGGAGEIIASNEVGDTQPTTGYYWDTDRWQCIELYVKLSTSAPVVRIWKDGTRIYQATTMTMPTSGAYSDLIYVMSYWNGAAPQGQTQYVDDFIVTTATPSNQDSYGNYMIGPGEYVPPVDTTPPVFSNPSPSTARTCPGSPINVTESINTDEPATVKWSLTDQAYDSMPNYFTTTGGYTHSRSVDRICGASYTIYCRGMDGAGNKSTASTAITYSVNAAAPPITDMDGPLIVSTTNPRYFTNDTGRAIYLTGSHTWSNFQDYSHTDPPAVFNFTTYINFLVGLNHNFIRLWSMALPKADFAPFNSLGGQEIFYSDPFPWTRDGAGTATDGKSKFDLDSWNDTYFTRLRDRCVAALNAGIYVGVMLFEGFHLQWCRIATDGFPLSGANNVNSIDAGTGTEAMTLDDAAVTAVQEAYVKKVIDTVQDLDNILYEIANEAGSGSTAWQASMIALIKAYEISEGYAKHPVGFTYQSPSIDSTNASMFASGADWISPVETDSDGYNYKTNPRPGAGSKVILSDTDHLWGLGGTSDWVWRSFTRGLNCLYMDCYNGPLNNCTSGTYDTSDATKAGIRAALGHTRVYADKMGLIDMTPQGSLTSTGYCLAHVGAEYLIYQTGTGAFDVYLTGDSATYDTEWFNPATGAETVGTQVVGGATRTVTPPFSGPAVLYLLSTVTPPPTETFMVGTRFGENATANVSGVMADATINSGSPTVNYSTYDHVQVYTWPAGTAANTFLVKVDLTSIPTTAVIADARLYLYMTGSGGTALEETTIHKITGDDPTISEATWNVSATGNNWTGAGALGDIAAPENTVLLNTTVGWKWYAIPTMVATWVATPSTNKGLLVASEQGSNVSAVDSYRTFASSNHADPNIRPMLIVRYSNLAPSGRSITTGGDQTLEVGAGSGTITW